MISNDKRDELNRFSNKVWGNAQAVLRRYDSEFGEFEYIDVEEYLDAFQFLFGPAVVPKILVRDEYRSALREFHTDLYDGGAYVTGHSGIGKTLFLIYLLVELLGQRRKVAAHDHSGDVFAFFTDAVEFYPVTDPTVLLGSRDCVWTLSNSDGQLQTPPHCFYGFGRQTRPIQSTLPMKGRWRWSKHARARCYIMDIWTEQEITNLANLSGLGVQRMIDLYRKWGGAPGTLLEYLDMPDHEIETLYRRSVRLAVTESWTMTSSILENKISENILTRFYFYRPFRISQFTDSCCRMLPRVVVPTLAICHILAEALQKLNESITSDFFDTLSLPCQPRQAARYIYKSWFHRFLSAGRSINCHWPHCEPKSINITALIAARQKEAKDVKEPYNWVPPRQAKSTSLPRITSLVLARPDELKDVKRLPYYWVAPSTFPGIDGALVYQDAIFAIQVNIRRPGKYRPAEEGLEKLRNSLPLGLMNVAWHLVFVGSDDRGIRRVANEQMGNVVLPTPEKDVTIGWSQVNPVEENIHFKISSGEEYLLEGELREPDEEEDEWGY